ncbi:MAG: hypothetical protein AB203_03960 [Parcubacteria bacterium C7867-008]|nr:MAG: hypothetical protein AB203_03960 [Parcubacteria bacterium C7867-008]
MDYLIIIPIEPFGERDLYPADQMLPAHCTLMPWFASNRFMPIDDLLEWVVEREELFPIQLIAQGREFFGPNNNVPVCVLTPTDNLKFLHTTLLVTLAQMGIIPKLQWVGAGYRPHISDTPTAVFKNGFNAQPSELVLVRRNEEGEKVVIGKYSFAPKSL